MDLKEFSRIAHGKDYITGYFRNQELVMEGIRKNVQGRFTQWRIRSLQKKHSLPGWDPKLVRSGCNHSIRQGFLQAIREQYGSDITAMVNDKCRILSSYRELSSGEVQSAVTLADRMQVEAENRKTVNQFLTSVAENDPSAVPPTLYDRIGKEKGALLLQELTRKSMEKAALSPGSVVPAEELEISVKTRYRSLVRDMQQALSGLPDPAEWEKTFLQKMMLDPSVLDIPESERPTLFSMLIQQYACNRKSADSAPAEPVRELMTGCQQCFPVVRNKLTNGIDPVKTVWSSLWEIHKLRFDTARDLAKQYPSERSHPNLFLILTRPEYCAGLPSIPEHLNYYRRIRSLVPILLENHRNDKTGITLHKTWELVHPGTTWPKNCRPYQFASLLLSHTTVIKMLHGMKDRQPDIEPPVIDRTVPETTTPPPQPRQAAIARIPEQVTKAERFDLELWFDYMASFMDGTALSLDSNWTWVGHGKTIKDLIYNRAKERKKLKTSFFVPDKFKTEINQKSFREAISYLVEFWMYAGGLTKQYGYTIYLKLPTSVDDMFSDYMLLYDPEKLLHKMPDRNFDLFPMEHSYDVEKIVEPKCLDIVSHLDRYCTDAYIYYVPSDLPLDDPFFR